MGATAQGKRDLADRRIILSVADRVHVDGHTLATAAHLVGHNILIHIVGLVEIQTNAGSRSGHSAAARPAQ